MKVCLACEERIIGRSDKKFCSDSCRNTFNYQQNSLSTNYIRNITYILKRNRRILASLCKKNTAKTSKIKLLSKGFSFEYFTHLRITQKKQTYTFNFDYGYLELEPNLFLIVLDSNAYD